MVAGLCICLIELMVPEKPSSANATIFEFIFISLVIVCGVVVNCRFRKKLHEEKQSMPIGRRGNVIEPVMNWFCILQVIFWPYDLLLIWSTTNQIISSDDIPPWMCKILLILMKSGRICIAYNSLFVAFIRYVHIVHYKVANQWNYENAAKWFKIASIGIPIAMETVGYLTHGYTQFIEIDEVQECLTSHIVSNSSINDALLVPWDGANWTMRYLPASLVHAISYAYVTITTIVFMNITEAILYLFVFRRMKRYNHYLKSLVL